MRQISCGRNRYRKLSGMNGIWMGSYRLFFGHGVRIMKTLSVVAACCVLCLFVYMHQIRTDATVYLDVNPAVEMKINRREKVISAEADNRDGHIILEDMDLENVDLDVAVNAVLGSMVKHGYLSEAKNMVLLSVDSKRSERAEN